MSISNAEYDGINYQRLYHYRFRDTPQSSRDAIWKVIAPWILKKMDSPRRLLDPAAGRGEFIVSAPAPKRTAVDLVNQRPGGWGSGIDFVLGDIRSINLEPSSFDGVFVSNFLVHLATQNEVANFLKRMHSLLAPGGKLAIMGPNFRYCAKEYFDCADHTLALTHIAIKEHLAASGFIVNKVIPKFLPYSFRSRVPQSSFLVKGYLNFPPAWRIMGKRFLIIAQRSDA